MRNNQKSTGNILFTKSKLLFSLTAVTITLASASSLQNNSNSFTEISLEDYNKLAQIKLDNPGCKVFSDSIIKHLKDNKITKSELEIIHDSFTLCYDRFLESEKDKVKRILKSDKPITFTL